MTILTVQRPYWLPTLSLLTGLVLFGVLISAPRHGAGQTSGGSGCTLTAYIASDSSPNPARVGDNVTARLTARPNDPTLTAECALTGKSCSWEVTKVEFRDSSVASPIDATSTMKSNVTVSGDGIEAPAEAVAQGFPAGYWNVTVQVTASWVIDKQAGCPDCDCGSCPSATTQLTFSFVVVGIELVVDVDDDPEGDNPDDTQPFQKFIDMPFQLRAVPYPADAAFPAGSPTWNLDSRPSGSVLSPNLGTGPVTSSITPDAEGTYSVSAFCGSDQVTVQVEAKAVRIRALLYKDPDGVWRYPDFFGSTWVIKGTSMDFKVISTMPQQGFPPGKPVWGGVATGKTGTQITINFNTTTADRTQPAMVSATCTNTASANYVVCELEGIVKPQLLFPSRSMTKVGLGESVLLSANITPQPDTNASIPFSLQWKTSTLSVGAVSDTTDTGSATYSAGLIPTGTGVPPSPRLVVTSGPSRGRVAGPYELSVVAPESGYMAKLNNSTLWHDSNKPSVGFMGYMFLLPDDVTFSKIQFREGAGRCKATGSLGQMNNTDHTTGNWLSIEFDPTIAAGSRRTNRVLGLDYPTVQVPRANQQTSGDLDWPIVWEYSGPGGTGVSFTIARMKANIDDSLTATIEKAGAGPFSVANGPPDSTPVKWPPNFP